MISFSLSKEERRTFALGARREDILRVQLIPGVASLSRNSGNRQHSLLIDQRLAAFLAEENRDRNPPFSLTGNAPVTDALKPVQIGLPKLSGTNLSLPDLSASTAGFASLPS